MFFIESERLKLVPLKYEQLLMQIQNPEEFAAALSIQVGVVDMPVNFRKELEQARDNCWLPDTKAYPELYHWYTNWQIVLKATNSIIGSIAFGGYPDDYGQTTLGYVIDTNLTSNGYATEAVRTLCQWGFTFSILKVVKADTTAVNLPSQRVLAKAGFKHTHTEAGTLFYQLSKPMP